MLRTKNHGRRTPHATRRTDIWITKSLPELSSGETKTKIGLPTNFQMYSFTSHTSIHKSKSTPNYLACLKTTILKFMYITVCVKPHFCWTFCHQKPHFSACFKFLKQCAFLPSRLLSISLLGQRKHGDEAVMKIHRKINKMVREPNVSPHKQIIKDDDVKECISIEYVENQKVSFFTFTIM